MDTHTHTDRHRQEECVWMGGIHLRREREHLSLLPLRLAYTHTRVVVDVWADWKCLDLFLSIKTERERERLRHTHRFQPEEGEVNAPLPVGKVDTTLNDGYLGLVIDEGRSEVRQVS